jgi:hypothetical protein
MICSASRRFFFIFFSGTVKTLGLFPCGISFEARNFIDTNGSAPFDECLLKLLLRNPLLAPTLFPFGLPVITELEPLLEPLTPLIDPLSVEPAAAPLRDPLIVDPLSFEVLLFVAVDEAFLESFAPLVPADPCRIDDVSLLTPDPSDAADAVRWVVASSSRDDISWRSAKLFMSRLAMS